MSRSTLGGKGFHNYHIRTLHSTTRQNLLTKPHVASQSTRLRQFTTHAPSSHSTDHKNLKFLNSSTSSYQPTNSAHYWHAQTNNT